VPGAGLRRGAQRRGLLNAEEHNGEYLILFLLLASVLSGADAFFVEPVIAVDAFLAKHHIAKDIFNPAIRVQLALALVTRNERCTPFALLRVLFAGHVEHCCGMSFIANVYKYLSCLRH
jgi:hypothetical protein